MRRNGPAASRLRSLLLPRVRRLRRRASLVNEAESTRLKSLRRERGARPTFWTGAGATSSSSIFSSISCFSLIASVVERLRRPPRPTLSALTEGFSTAAAIQTKVSCWWPIRDTEDALSLPLPFLGAGRVQSMMSSVSEEEAASMALRVLRTTAGG